MSHTVHVPKVGSLWYSEEPCYWSSIKIIYADEKSVLFEVLETTKLLKYVAKRQLTTLEGFQKVYKLQKKKIKIIVGVYSNKERSYYFTSSVISPNKLSEFNQYKLITSKEIEIEIDDDIPKDCDPYFCDAENGCTCKR